jgi:hypothetical protein
MMAGGDVRELPVWHDGCNKAEWLFARCAGQAYAEA